MSVDVLVQIIDSLGRIVLEKAYKGIDYQQDMKIDVRNLANASYHLKLLTGTKTYIKSFVISK